MSVFVKKFKIKWNTDMIIFVITVYFTIFTKPQFNIFVEIFAKYISSFD